MTSMHIKDVPSEIGGSRLSAPELLDPEVTSVLRRRRAGRHLDERLGAPLLTADARPVGAPGLRCPVEVLR